MKISHLNVLLVVVTFFASTQSVIADDFKNNSMREWQLKRLMHPGEQQLAMEHQQKVFLYMGLKDREIDLAMNVHFDRIGSMMIANVIRTDHAGQVMRNPETGEVLTEEDGC